LIRALCIDPGWTLVPELRDHATRTATYCAFIEGQAADVILIGRKRRTFMSNNEEGQCSNIS
jgi:hypothetical protein